MLPKRKAGFILLFYLCWLGFAAFASYKFMGNVQAQFAAPAGTLVRETEDLAYSLMTQQVNHDPLFILVKSANATSPPVVRGDGRNASIMHDSPLCVLTRFVESIHAARHGIVSVKSYCGYARYQNFARQFVSKDNRSALIAVDLNATSGVLAEGGSSGPGPVIDLVNKFLADNPQLTAEIHVETTSIVQVFDTLKSSLLGDLLVIDGAALPLATLALVICLRSGRMAMLPIPSVLLSVTTALAIMWPISTAIAVSSFAPDMTSGVLLAIGVDFSLFIGSRFTERVALARVRGWDLSDELVQLRIVLDAVSLTSHNIIVSGSAVASALGFLILVPVSAVSTVGLCLLVGALCSVTVSLTFQPALLLFFFDFFREDPVWTVVMNKCPWLRAALEDPLLTELDDDGGASGNGNNDNNVNGSTNSLLTAEEAAERQRHEAQKQRMLSGLTLAEQAHSGLLLADGTSGLASGGVAARQQAAVGAAGGDDGSLDAMEQRGADLIHYPRGSTHRMASSQASSISDLKAAGSPAANVAVLQQQQQPSGDALALLRPSPEDVARRAQARSPWFRLASFVIRHPYATIVGVLACCAPFCWLSSKTALTFDLALQTPVGAPVVRAIAEVSATIGNGALTVPFIVTVDTGVAGGVARVVDTHPLSFDKNITVPVLEFNATLWATLRRLVQHLHTRMEQPLDRILSLVSFPGMPAWFNSTLADAALLCASVAESVPALAGWADLDACLEYQLLFNSTVDASHRMAILMVAPTVNPFGSKSYEFCNSLRDALESFDAGSGSSAVRVGFMGASSDSCAILHKMNELLPLQLSMMCLVIFVITFCAFRSVYVALRMIICLSLPISVSIGVGVVLYQVEPFNRVWPVETNAYSWTVLSFLFVLLSALGCDYSIFLDTHIYQLRSVGFSTEAAIKRATARSWRTISFACLIMMISFSAMAALGHGGNGGIMMMSSFGLIAAVGTCIDSFVVRPFIHVPSFYLMAHLFGERATWWPRRMPEPFRDENDMTEVEGDAATPKWLFEWAAGELLLAQRAKQDGDEEDEDHQRHAVGDRTSANNGINRTAPRLPKHGGSIYGTDNEAVAY